MFNKISARISKYSITRIWLFIIQNYKNVLVDRLNIISMRSKFKALAKIMKHLMYFW